jgi:hypothetical protein
MRSYWNLKLSDVVRGVIGVLLFVPSFAQFSKPDAEKATSQETYLFPIKPGQPASLAGTMGELRTTHFHSGIDIRTNNEIGWPVLAAKSGYVSRVSMSGTGYGNVLYITHPDGHVTLYAHLEKVNGALGDYVLRERYRRKSAEIDLYFREGQFPVQRGDTIALSGNTGSSGGPHLHFDIRDSEDHALDPLTFGFKEVKDITPPHAQKIALKTMDMDSRVNDQFGRFEFYLARVGKDYTFTAPILARGRIGIEVLGYDRLELNQFKTGINFIEVYVNGQMTFCQTIERIDLAETRNIYTLMDFRVMRFNGNKFYKLYLDDGARQNFYEKSPGDGIIPIDPAKTTSVRIVLKDTDGNSSDVTFRLQPSAPATSIVALDAQKAPEYEFLENTLVIQSPPCDTAITAYADGKVMMIPKAYGSTKKSVFLANLKTTRLDSAVVCGKTLHTHLVATVPSGTAYRYYSDRMDLTFPEQALYDTLYLQARHVLAPDSSSEIFSIGSYYTPLHRSVEITLKPLLRYPRTEQVSVYRKVGAGYAWAGGTWGPDRVTFFTRDLGDYTILVDSVAPVIKPVYVNNVAARFKIRDNLSGIKSYEANINGQWLLMNFDAKTATLYSERSSDKQLLKGTFELTVTDNAGNKSVYKQHIP